MTQNLIRSLELPEAEMHKLREHLDTNPKMLIVTHANPDPDAIGSAAALYSVLADNEYNVDVACIDPVPESMCFVTRTEEFKTDIDLADYNTIIFLDCGDKRMTKFQKDHPDILESDRFFRINIDHHPSNDFWGDVNIVITHAASTTQILFEMIKVLGLNISPAIATALLTGLYGDTGAFMHQNTTPATYYGASELIKKGGNVTKIAQNIFHTYEFKKLKLWGKILQNLHLTEDGAAIVGVEREEYEQIGCTRADLAGVIDYINSMPEARYCVILSEDEKGNVKASLRTRKPDVDVKALAEQYGGGGHIKASGFTIPKGRLKKEVKWKIVTEEEE